MPAITLKTIEWKNNAIKLIDQTLLPGELKYEVIKDVKALWHAIKLLKVRGAPALGAAACFGVYLGIKNSTAKTRDEFIKELDNVIQYLASSRPTAKNLFWGLQRMRTVALASGDKPIAAIKAALLKEAGAVMSEDQTVCRWIAHYGAPLFKSQDRVLTICNTGSLATIDYGTALGVIYKAVEQKKSLEIYACETRPLLQGARLTCWELSRKRIPVTLICDSMAASLMKAGKIDKVIVGADRIAANGDTANKIGTYNLAVLCAYHKIPLYVAAPFSTFDMTIASGKEIIIEERSADEVTKMFFKKPIAPHGVHVYNPAFDVTDHQLISAFITERGIIRAPYVKNIHNFINRDRG